MVSRSCLPSVLFHFRKAHGVDPYVKLIGFKESGLFIGHEDKTIFSEIGIGTRFVGQTEFRLGIPVKQVAERIRDR